MGMTMSDPPTLVTDPVEGWRVWRLTLDGDVFRLGSLMRSNGWPRGIPVRAWCRRHEGPSPAADCECGIYAVSRPSTLMARSFGSSAAVIGSVSLWGRVVQHRSGARAEFAYPSRLRLVCGPCLSSWRGAVDPVCIVHDRRGLMAVCERHASSVTGPAWFAREIQARLLDAYQVELLPLERARRTVQQPFRKPFGAFKRPLFTAARSLPRSRSWSAPWSCRSSRWRWYSARSSVSSRSFGPDGREATWRRSGRR